MIVVRGPAPKWLLMFTSHYSPVVTASEIRMPGSELQLEVESDSDRI